MGEVKYFSIPRLWPGSTVFVLGGGPSLNNVDLSLIKDKRVVAVNRAYKLGEWDVVWFGDLKFWRAYKKDLREYPGLVITCNENAKLVNHAGVWLKRVKRSKKKPRGIDTDTKRVCWNGSSGGSAINAAFHFGAKRIALLGFDMNPDVSEKNWHDDYEKDLGEKFSESRRYEAYKRHSKAFSIIKKDADSFGVEILNTNLSSNIEDFTFTALEDLL